MVADGLCPGGVRVDHQNQYSGVAEDDCLGDAIRGSVGVVTNRAVGEAVDEFWALVEMGFRCPRHSMSV